MDRGILRRGALGLGFLAGVAGLSAGVFAYAEGQALAQVAQRGEADLALAIDRLSGQLQRYQDMAVLMAGHPGLREGPDAARALLLEAADKTAALNILHIGRDGEVRAEAHPGRGGADGPHVARAMQGALGSGHGVLTGGLRGYFYAAPEFGPDGRVIGALVVVVDIETVEWDWLGSRPAVFFTDARGEVFISNRSELLHWHREGAGLAPPEGKPARIETGERAGYEIWEIEWGPYIPRRALHLARELPVIGLRGEALIDTTPARRLAGLQAAVFAALWLVFGAFLFVATERRRTLRQANRMLEARVSERTAELSGANAALRREVAEREEAEAALKRAQAELVQAGKLSALGQMSAGISHELNQPLMAIQQYAENGEAFLDRGKPQVARDNLGRIATLAERAARIIRNLRAFARNESEPMGKVDLGQVIDQAVELTGARLRREGVTLDWQRPAAPVPAWGGEVRLGQVFVNLINNAADAMAGQEGDRRIAIELRDGARPRVTVRDSGPGIADPERIFEPFYSTKAVGHGDEEEGMGLGLSISYGLVQSFGGRIRGENAAPGDDYPGAVFTVELDPWREEEQAA